MTGHFFPCNSFDIITIYAYFNSQLCFIFNKGIYINVLIKQQGEELGMGKSLLQLCSSTHAYVVDELLSCVFVYIRCANRHSVTSLQVTNARIFRERKIFTPTKYVMSSNFARNFSLSSSEGLAKKA